MLLLTIIIRTYWNYIPQLLDNLSSISSGGSKACHGYEIRYTLDLAGIPVTDVQEEAAHDSDWKTNTVVQWLTIDKKLYRIHPQLFGRSENASKVRLGEHWVKGATKNYDAYR